jgi:hypothetical protein
MAEKEVRTIDAMSVNGPVSSAPTEISVKKSNSKVITIILAILGVLFLCCCGSFAGFGGLGKLAEEFAKQEIDKINQNVDESKQSDSLDAITDEARARITDLTPYTVVETDAYTFYAPKTFNKISVGGTKEHYQKNGNNPAMSYSYITLGKAPLSSLTSGEIKEFSDCEGSVDSLAKVYASDFKVQLSDVLATKTEVIKQLKGYGCRFAFDITFSNGKVFLINDLYIKSDNTEMYVLTILGDDPNSEEGLLLQSSQDLFLLK